MRTGELWEERWRQRKKYETDEIREERGGHINSQLWVSGAEGKEADEAVMARDQRGFCSRQQGYKAAVYFLVTLKDSNQFPLWASKVKQPLYFPKLQTFPFPSHVFVACCSRVSVSNITCQSYVADELAYCYCSTGSVAVDLFTVLSSCDNCKRLL